MKLWKAQMKKWMPGCQLVLHYSPLRPILGGENQHFPHIQVSESMAISKLPLSGQGVHPDMKFGPVWIYSENSKKPGYPVNLA